jgi:hypothetical protein
MRESSEARFFRCSLSIVTASIVGIAWNFTRCYGGDFACSEVGTVITASGLMSALFNRNPSLDGLSRLIGVRSHA